MKKLFKKYWPIFFILSIWFIFASPYFLKNKAPYSSSYQNNFVPPWSYYEKYWGPVKNNAMPDIVGQIYPWRYFSINVWRDHQVPFWNPYSFSGNPNLANYQSAVFSPLNFLFFVLPFRDAWSLSVLLQPLLASLFMYFLMKEFRVSNFGSILSSVAFMFSGFMVVWMAYGTLSLAIAFLPLCLLAIEKCFKKPNLFWLSVLSLSFPLSFFSGHFQTSLYFLIFALLFFVFKSFQTRDIKKSLFAFSAIVLGLVVSLPQILPSIELYGSSVRSQLFIQKGWGIPFNYLITSLAPDFFGNAVTRNDWFGYYAEWSSFIGIIPLLLSFLAILGKKKALPLFFFTAGILFLMLAVESPLLQLISFLKIPVLSTSNPTRIIVLFSFSFSVAAGFGLDNLRLFVIEGKIKKLIVPFFLLGVLFLFTWSLLIIAKVLPPDKLLIAKRNFILPTFLFFICMVLVFISLKYRKIILLIVLFLMVASSVDSLRFAQKWMPFDPKEQIFVDIPIISAIKKNIGDGRYFGNLGDQVDSYYGFSSIEGYDPLYIGRYGEFIQTASSGKFEEAQRSVVKISRNGKYTDRALDLLGVSLFFHPIADTNQGWAYPVWNKKEKYALVYEDSKFQLFKNNTALNRATLFYTYEVIHDPKSLLAKFYNEQFDFKKILLLEESPGFLNIKEEGKGKVKIISYTPNKITIKISSNNQALLFLSDNYYPKWKAKINGKEAKILRADYAFRAVVVPKGDSTVVFTYSGFF